MKRFLVLWICALMVVSSVFAVSPSYAEKIGTRYTYISILEAGLSISGSTASCYGSVSSSSSYDISIRMTLMRKTGSIWVTVKTWTGSGDFTVYLLKSYGLSTTGDYKIIVLGKILDSAGNVLESASRSSGIETY